MPFFFFSDANLALSENCQSNVMTTCHVKTLPWVSGQQTLTFSSHFGV